MKKDGHDEEQLVIFLLLWFWFATILYFPSFPNVQENDVVIHFAYTLEIVDEL